MGNASRRGLILETTEKQRLLFMMLATNDAAITVAGAVNARDECLAFTVRPNEAFLLPGKSRQGKSHGPPRKGRGGKIRRWQRPV